MLGVELVLILFSLIPTVFAGVLNITIDDTNGDGQGRFPQYQPSKSWEDHTCAGCYVQPDSSKTHDNTFHAATYDPSRGKDFISFSFSFRGSAVYVYFLLANENDRDATTETKCDFAIDGQQDSTFHHVPDPTPDIYYNQLAYSKEGLSQDTDHTVTCSMSEGETNYWVAFDYALVTVETEDPTTDVVAAPPTNSPKATTSPSETSETSASTSSTDTATATDTTTTVDPGPTTGSTSGPDSGSDPDPSPNPDAASASSTNAANGSQGQAVSASSTANVGLIAGVTVGVIAAIIIAILLIVCVRRRRRRRGTSPLGVDLLVDSPLMMQNNLSHLSNPTAYPQVDPFMAAPYAPAASASSFSPYQQPQNDLHSTYFGATEDASVYPGLAYDQSSVGGGTSTVGSPPALGRRATVRDARQRELEHQVLMLRQTLENVQAGASTNPSTASGDSRDVRDVQDGRDNKQKEADEAEKAHLRSQVVEMQERVRQLETAQSSPWAQGYSDDPPPGYSSSAPHIL